MSIPDALEHSWGQLKLLAMAAERVRGRRMLDLMIAVKVGMAAGQHPDNEPLYQEVAGKFQEMAEYKPPVD